MDKIKYVLCNEKGGPNLENLLGIAIAIVIGYYVYEFSKTIKTLGKTSIQRMGAMDDYFS